MSAELYVVLSNLSSKQNLGTFLRTASAFGATQVVVVGSLRFGTHGAHRAQKYVDIVHFYDFQQAREYLKTKNCTIYGVSQTRSSAFEAHQTPYAGSSAFVIDNESPGLSDDQFAICDHLVHVPFHSAHPTSLPLDATVVAALVLHHFCYWAKFSVRPFEATSTQGKFVLDAYPTPQMDPLKTAERQQKRQQQGDGLETDEGLSDMFS